MAIPVIYNLRSVRARWESAIVAVLGIAGTVGVFIAMLSLARGFQATLVASGSDDNALITRAGATSVWVEVTVPVKSLCPCSKEISEYGAHNQRSHVIVRIEPLEEIGWLELVRFAEDSASSEIWAMLKRADEKWVTERAYENPKFVEDLVRDVALRLNADPRVGRYSVDVENFESIHAHSAMARIERL